MILDFGGHTCELKLTTLAMIYNWWSEVQMEPNDALYHIGLKNHDFETHVERHEEKSNVEKVVDISAYVNENVHISLL